MEIRAGRTKDGVLLTGDIPQEIASSPSLEIFPLRDGIYLLAIRGFAPKASASSSPKGGPALPEKEKGVVRKLLSVRFEKRTPAEVARLLSREEKETLALLMKKGEVQLFHKGKYEQEGVYNVSDFAFNAVREPPGAAVLQQAVLPISSPSHLEKHGWMVLESEPEARSFAASFPDKVKSGEVMGVRAFDRHFYFVTRRFYEEWAAKVQQTLSKSEKNSEEIAAEAGLAPEGCRALLFHLCEAGDAMEKHRGKFSKA